MQFVHTRNRWSICHCEMPYGWYHSDPFADTTGVFCQFSSVDQSCPTLCNPMNRSTPGLPVHHQLLEFIQTLIHWVSDAIQPSHSLSSPSPPAPNPSPHQGLSQWVNSSHEVAKILEWVAYPFFRGSSWPRNQTRVSCITSGVFTSWATREAPHTLSSVQ